MYGLNVLVSKLTCKAQAELDNQRLTKSLIAPGTAFGIHKDAVQQVQQCYCCHCRAAQTGTLLLQLLLLSLLLLLTAVAAGAAVAVRCCLGCCQSCIMALLGHQNRVASSTQGSMQAAAPGSELECCSPGLMHLLFRMHQLPSAPTTQ